MNAKSPITIREYQESDLNAAVNILREMQAAELPFNARMKPVAAIGPWYMAMLQEQVAAENAMLLVAERQGACVGFALVLTNQIEDGTLELQAYSHAHITELGVAEFARGQGIGKALLDECERRAKAAGRDEITLAVYCENAPAHRLYLKSGFADLKVRMRKHLA